VEQPDLLGLFVSPLNELGLTYMITGAVAAVVYGEPRMTRDLNVVVALGPGDAARLAAAFPARRFYVAPLEVMEDERRREAGGHFNIIHHDTALKADVYLAGADALHAWALPQRIRQDVGGLTVWLAPPEYVILRKLEWFRDSGSSRHRDDVRAMLRVSGERLDRTTLQQWVSRLGLEREWEAVAT
jgi:hypothetical protein